MQSFDALPAPRKVAFGRGWRWIVEAFYIVRQQPLTWVLLALAYLVINFIVNMIPLLGGPLSFFLAPVFAAGFSLAAKKCEQGSELELGDLFAGFKTALRPLINVGMLYLAILIVIGVALGLLMGAMGVSVAKSDPNAIPVIAGPIALFAFIGGVAIFLVSLAYWFAPALVTLNQARPWQAIRTSLQAGLANWGAVLVSGLMLAVLAFIAMIPLGLGLLLWFPVLYVTAYTGWKDIFGQSAAPARPDEPVVF